MARTWRSDLAILTLDTLFHRLWTKAVGTTGYDKQEWQELGWRLQQLERRKTQRRGGTEDPLHGR